MVDGNNLNKVIILDWGLVLPARLVHKNRIYQNYISCCRLHKISNLHASLPSIPLGSSYMTYTSQDKYCTLCFKFPNPIYVKSYFYFRL